MCGIAGFYGDFEGHLLSRMNSRLAHRGPDDSGIYHDEPSGVGLAHNRLSIIDLSPAGRQPMWDHDSRYVIVYNGEIYNHLELKRELTARGHTFTSASDTEVLLTAFVAWGSGALTRLNGIFSFAIYDTRERSLFLARDCFGVKPLYYCQSSNGFLFASEMKALLQEVSVPRDIDVHALQTYLTFLWSPAPHTLLAHVKKLPPGHAMTVKDKRITRIWKYYEIPYDQEIVDLPDADLETQLDQALENAVSRQMISDVPVGAFLSGGLDSSAIVTYARRHYDRGKLQCFTIAFPDGEYSDDGMAMDLPYARKVAKHLDVDLHVITVDKKLVDYLPGMIWHLDEPQADFAAINVYLISRLARDHGVKVLLSGAAGDDILAGYSRHRALLMERYWSWLPRRARLFLQHASALVPRTVPAFRRLSKAFSNAGGDPEERLMTYFFWLPEPLSLSLLNPELTHDLPCVGEALAESLKSIPRETPDLNRMLFLDTKFFLADHNLNYTDKMSMAAGIETRVPFLDNDLVRLAARLPVRAKLYRNEGKRILKKLMTRHLPREVVYRPKTGFGVPFRSWFRGDLRPFVEEILSEGALRQRGLFSPEAVNRLVLLDRQGRVDAAGPLFAVICAELWFQVFEDHSHPASLPLS